MNPFTTGDLPDLIISIEPLASEFANEDKAHSVPYLNRLIQILLMSITAAICVISRKYEPVYQTLYRRPECVG
ncbi:hypothetical protein ACTXT7_012048 [Hymenolepis weldensis]